MFKIFVVAYIYVERQQNLFSVNKSAYLHKLKYFWLIL